MQCHLMMIGCIAELAKARPEAEVSERSPIDDHVEEVGDDHVEEVGDEEAVLEVGAEENPPGEEAAVVEVEDEEVEVEDEEVEVEVEDEEVEEARPIQVLQEAAASQQMRDPVMFLVRSC